MVAKKAYLVLLTLNETTSFIVSTIFIVLVLWSKHKHSKVQRVKTIILYIAFYEFASLLVCIDGISDNYQLYEKKSVIDILFDLLKITGFILSHELFFILMIERLYYPFKDTIHKMSKPNIIILVSISIIIEVLHFFIRVIINYDLMPSTHIELLLPLMIISVLFGLLLISIFGHKLFDVLITSRKSLYCGEDLLMNSPNTQFSVISRMSLNSHQLTLIRTITRNAILSVFAIIFRNLGFLLYGFRSISNHRLIHKNDNKMYLLICILYCLLNVCLFMQLLCVYLSYSFFIGSRICYNKCCGGIHKVIQKYGVKYAQSKMTQINMKTLQSMSKCNSHSYELLNNEDDFDLTTDLNNNEAMQRLTIRAKKK
eukprot:246404_1